MPEINANMFTDCIRVIPLTAKVVPAYAEEVIPVYTDYVRLPSSSTIEMSVIITATSAGTIACKIELEQSNDGTNWSVPADVSALESSWNGAGQLIRDVDPDLTRYARLKLSGLATHSADATFNITINLVAGEFGG